MKTYQGIYKIKNPSKYDGDPTKVVFRSMWERHCFKWCDENPNIKGWSSEETVVPYFYDVDKKYHRYFVDLKITFNEGRTILVEIKPEKQTNVPKKTGTRNTQRYVNEAMTYVKNMNKWEAATTFAKDRGWEFQIWTEKTLQEMGIMPNQRKLKPLKPIKKKPKVQR
jgi:hypothetical protein